MWGRTASRRRETRGWFVAASLLAGLVMVPAGIQGAYAQSRPTDECRDVIDPILGGLEELARQAEEFPDDRDLKRALSALRRGEERHQEARRRVERARMRVPVHEGRVAASLNAANQAFADAAIAQARAQAAGGNNAALNRAAADAANRAARAGVKAKNDQEQLEDVRSGLRGAEDSLRQEENNLRDAKRAFDGALEKARRESGGGQQRLDDHGMLDRRCPTGLYVGLQIPSNAANQEILETFANTGAPGNKLHRKNHASGAGIVAGYNFRPWGNQVIVGPFASFDLLHQTTDHSFAGGSFIGTTTHWTANAGVKAGVMTGPGIYLYGLAAIAVLNKNLNINFGGPATSSNRTIAGFSAGLGGEWRPAFLQRWQRPVSLFVQYQHTWWDNSTLIRPAASPLFNYEFRRQDDTVRFGVNVYFDGAFGTLSPPASGALIVK